MSLPIFYFTYADPDGELEQLKRERKSHHNLFIPKFLESKFGFFQNPDFTKDNLNFGFDEFFDKITIFHFSGHAGMGEIKLQDGSSYIAGIALQMKKALSAQLLPKLVLVFLNGCSTNSMVNMLLQAGVPIVIGTSAPVDDGVATDFSINFYESIIEDSTISAAFENAVAKLKTVDNTIAIQRSIGLDDAVDNKPLWGIFSKDDNKSLLDWKLSDLLSSLPPHSIKYEINGILRGSLYNSLHKAGLIRIKQLEERRLSGEDIREDINAALLLGYPGPISYKLARLLNVEIENSDKSLKELYEIHLNNLYEVYQSLSELLFLIMISQLWDECLNINGANNSQLSPALPVDYEKIRQKLELIKEYFLTTRKQRRFFNYIPKIRAIREIFDKAGIAYFVNELEQLKIALESDKDFISCCDYFEDLRNVLKANQYNRFSINEWEEYCENGEKALSSFFNVISFFTNYDFGILKSIELSLPRFLSKPTYLYKLLKIPKSGNPKYLSFSPNLSGFTSVRSIVMLKTQSFGGIQTNVQKVTGVINLSPFMLDFNVTDLNAEKGNLLVYSHYEESTGNFLYEEALRSNTERYIKKTDEIIFEETKRTFTTFFEVLFNEKTSDIIN